MQNCVHLLVCIEAGTSPTDVALQKGYPRGPASLSDYKLFEVPKWLAVPLKRVVSLQM